MLRTLMSRARAFVFAAEEDFGITLVEAQACGTPVICLGKGGALDSVIPGETGTFFDEQTPTALIGALADFEAHAANFDCHKIRRNAERFGIGEFRRNFAALVNCELGKRAGLPRAEDSEVRREQYAYHSSLPGAAPL
jgi:glycosyltransferase involved in cell wall biosynthesis